MSELTKGFAVNKDDRVLEDRPNAVTGKAKRWVKKPSAEDLERGRGAGHGIHSLDDGALNESLAAGLGVPPEDTEGRFEYRRRVIVNGIMKSESLSGEEQLLLGARYGLDGQMVTLEELAEKQGTTRLDVRQREIVAMRKVEAEFPELVDVYNFDWARRS